MGNWRLGLLPPAEVWSCQGWQVPKMTWQFYKVVWAGAVIWGIRFFQAWSFQHGSWRGCWKPDYDLNLQEQARPSSAGIPIDFSTAVLQGCRGEQGDGNLTPVICTRHSCSQLSSPHWWGGMWGRYECSLWAGSLSGLVEENRELQLVTCWELHLKLPALLVLQAAAHNFCFQKANWSCWE